MVGEIIAVEEVLYREKGFAIMLAINVYLV